jgi:ribonuclease R
LTKRKTPSSDPFADREAEKYAKPAPSREFILAVLNQSARPMTHPELCDHFQLGDDEELIEALRRRLIAMSRDGQLISNRRDAFMPVEKVDLMRGRVQGHRDGYGFVIRADGGEDIYLHGRQMRKVFDGDEVLVRLSGENYRGKEEGAIVEVLARNTWQLAGRFFSEEGVQFVRPENARITQDIMIPYGSWGGAEPGQIVVVEITQQPDKNRLPMGKVIRVLGDHMAPGMEIELAIQSHGIPSVWPAEVETEAAAIPPQVQEKDKQHRVDLRHLPLVTIDGEDARDFDDAVLCERRRGGWRLYVAIADVSHYVAVDSALDREARNRGNSVYFPDYVVPMLPEVLSNGLCSLNPGVDRLCMVCEMTISDGGRITGYQFYEAVMHSHARLTYNQVWDMLSNPESEHRQTFAHVLPQVELLHSLYTCLRAARDERGAIDFETVETRIIFDSERKIERIVPVRRNEAHKLIEECMLCANVCAANFLQKHQLLGLYRVHEGPTEQKLTNLREFLGELGLGLGGGNAPTSADYQQLLQAIANRPDANMIQTVMLRSLRQAMYQMENNGHFGLGYDAYTHFTSPIRRYPDLLVHRALRSVIRSDQASRLVRRVDGAKPLPRRQIYPYTEAEMLVLGEQCSLTERRADEATRDVISWLKCEYLRDQVGEVYPGLVSAVTGFGLFVELTDLYVEGLVHISSLPHDYYRFEPAQHRLVGERTRKIFGLGDELLVRVARVDLDNRKVDFELESITVTRRGKLPQAPAAQPAKTAKASAAGKSGKAAVKPQAASKSKSVDKSKGAKKSPEASAAKAASRARKKSERAAQKAALKAGLAKAPSQAKAKVKAKGVTSDQQFPKTARAQKATKVQQAAPPGAKTRKKTSASTAKAAKKTLA